MSTRLAFVLLITCSLQAQTPADLRLERFDFHQFEDGPTLAANYEFLPGETVWFSARINGFKIDKKDDDQRVKLAWQLRFLDPVGVALDKPRNGVIEDRLSFQDLNQSDGSQKADPWRPKFLGEFQVPAFAIGGTYKIPVTIKDEFASKEATRTIEFRVKGPALPEVSALTIRGFRFLRSEEDSSALRDATYRPGSMLWAKFDIAGFKFGDRNKFDVEYGLAVLDADGKELFAQPQAAADSKETLYPQRWVPGTLSLTLNDGVARANYILMVTAKDKISGATAELREPFRVQ